MNSKNKELFDTIEKTQEMVLGLMDCTDPLISGIILDMYAKNRLILKELERIRNLLGTSEEGDAR